MPNAVGSRGASSVLLAAAEGMTDHGRDALLAAVHPWAAGRSYLNVIGVADTRTEVVRTADDPADPARLTALKSAYDPAPTFRVNSNIPPQ